MGNGILGIVNKSVGIFDQLVVDEDLRNKLKYEFATTLVNTLYVGKGSSVTKIVSVCLIAAISLALLIKYLIEGPAVSGIGVGELFIGPGMLVGSYGTGKTVQKIMEKKYGNGNGNGGSSNVRPPKSYRPQYRDITKNVGDNSDERPSDTKRDHPSGR